MPKKQISTLVLALTLGAASAYGLETVRLNGTFSPNGPRVQFDTPGTSSGSGSLYCCCTISGPGIHQIQCASTTGYQTCSEINGRILATPDGQIFGTMTDCWSTIE